MSLFDILFTHKKSLLLYTGLAAILGFSLASLLPKYYKAETIIFPPNTHVSDHLISAGLRFGNDKEIDEHIQLLSSNVVRDSIIATFDLGAHYGLDASHATFWYDLYKEYDANVKVSRTRYNSIAVAVWDQSPTIATDMANRLIEVTDRLKSAMFLENVQAAYVKNDRAYREKKSEIEGLAMALEQKREANYSEAMGQKAQEIKQLRERLRLSEKTLTELKQFHKFYELNDQLSFLYQHYLSARTSLYEQDGMIEVLLSKDNIPDTLLVRHQGIRNAALVSMGQLKDQIDSLKGVEKQYNRLLTEKGQIQQTLALLETDYQHVKSDFAKEFHNQSFSYLKLEYERECEQLLDLKEKRDEMKEFLAAQAPKSYLVSPAKIPQKKDKPSRMIYTVIAAFSAFVVYLAFLLFRYNQNFSASNS